MQDVVHEQSGNDVDVLHDLIVCVNLCLVFALWPTAYNNLVFTSGPEAIEAVLFDEIFELIKGLRHSCVFL